MGGTKSEREASRIDWPAPKIGWCPAIIERRGSPAGVATHDRDAPSPRSALGRGGRIPPLPRGGRGEGLRLRGRPDRARDGSAPPERHGLDGLALGDRAVVA